MIYVKVDEITALIKENITPSGKSIADLKNILNVDEAEISSCLYRNLGKEFFQDNRYRWYLRAKYISATTRRNDDNGMLSRVCSYYLDCIRQTDNTQYSCFAVSKYDKPDYTEINELPGLEGLSLYSDVIMDLRSRATRSRTRKEVYFGYPVRLKKISSKKGWQGFIVEPIVIYSVNFDSDSPVIEFQNPTINPSIIKSNFSGDSVDELSQEMITLEEDLGILNDIVASPADIVRRLAAIRSAWDWKDEINPFNLNCSQPIININEDGIYNKAVFFMAERSMYTKGLESELVQLASPELESQQNALTSLLVDDDSNSDKGDFLAPLLEVLPMNNEQRQAVKKALVNDLTVVTGPPGTGKSQLITNLIINAVWQGQTVIFASKNNKAVDVVDKRVNYATNHEVMIRTGSGQYQTRTAEHLLNLINSTTSQIDREDYDHYKSEYAKKQGELQKIQGDIEALRNLRNALDDLDKKFEDIINDKGRDYINVIKLLDSRAINESVDRINYLRKILKPKTVIEKLKLIFKKNTYNIEYLEQEKKLRDSLSYDKNKNEEESVDSILRLAQENISDRLFIDEYDAAVAGLKATASFENLTKKQVELQKQITSTSDRLWRLYMKLGSDRLTDKARSTISKYKSILKMIQKDTDVYKDLGADVYRVYKKITEDAVYYLPAWAVTALSAKGKLPFQSGLFDLVIFDEASQCDIASALPLLYRAKRAVIIGDPKQLSHVTTLSSKQDRLLMAKHNLLADCPEWSFTTNSLYDLAQSTVHKSNFISLQDHHRSHGDIINFANDYFYGGNLRIATRYDNLVAVDGSSGVRWIDTGCTDTVRPKDGGAVNEKEADKVVDVIYDLLVTKGYIGSVGVVSPFRYQANLIQEKVVARLDISLLDRAGFMSDTVHRFQGDERDVMIFSSALSEGASFGAVAFVANNANLFNVALTRARAQFIVVGDKDWALQSDIPVYKKFASYTDQEKNIRNKYTQTPTGDPNVYDLLHGNAVFSDWEIKLYKALLAEGIKTIPQYSIDSYRLDLALVDKKRKLDIEVDGERYHREWSGELTRRDQLRNQRMFELGWDVQRFWVYEVRDDIKGCVEVIKRWLSDGKTE